jgi:hypothetical protein
MVSLGRMIIEVRDNPSRINELRPERSAQVGPGPSGLVRNEFDSESDQNRNTVEFNDTRKKFDSFTTTELVIRIVKRYPGIRLYLINQLCARAGKSNDQSGMMSYLVREGKLKREKDGDSFRYFVNN